MQRREDIYGDDANEFRPERWDTLRTSYVAPALGPRGKRLTKATYSWQYVPFSGGPRICIGQQFALTMMSYLTARFFQAFEKIEARDDRPMLQKTSSTTSLSNGCWVSLTPASDATGKQY